MDATFLGYVIVAALGALVGSGELVSRYRDAPGGALRTRPALFYILIYRKAFEGLPPYCLALMQNVPDEDQQKMLQALALFDKDQSIGTTIKVRILGLQLMNVVGPNVLTAAVQSLRKQMQNQVSGAGSEKPE